MLSKFLFTAAILCCFTTGLSAQDNPYYGPSIDTVSLPASNSDDTRIISFYQKYLRKQSIRVHFVLNAAPKSNGSNWETIYAEGTLGWADEITLEGSLAVQFKTGQEDGTRLIDQLFNKEAEKIKLSIDTRDGKVTVFSDVTFIYPTTIRNNTIHGFNNSNRSILLTLENYR